MLCSGVSITCYVIFHTQQNFLIQVTLFPEKQQIHCYFLNFTLLLLFILGDKELNPGPNTTNSTCKCSICHWNLNSLAVHNFEIVRLLDAYNTFNKFDIICVSESYLDSSFSSDNEVINRKGYKLVRADHSNNTKRRGVCVYFRKILILHKYLT